MELILVLGLVALSAALAAPSLGRFAGGRELQDQATHLLAILQYAQDQAITQGLPHRVQVEPSQGTYGITFRQNGSFVAPAREIGRVFEVGPRLTLAWVGDREVAQRGFVQFEPDGEHDLAGLQLQDPRGRTATVYADTPAEPFRIVLSP